MKWRSGRDGLNFICRTNFKCIFGLISRWAEERKLTYMLFPIRANYFYFNCGVFFRLSDSLEPPFTGSAISIIRKSVFLEAWSGPTIEFLSQMLPPISLRSENNGS
jgi:hypothetical protein